MPLTFSPPPGIPEFCNAGKHLKTVISFLSCFFAAPVYFQLRFLTGNKGKADRAVACTTIIIGSGDLSIREAAADIRSRLESNVDFDMGVRALSVTSRFQEKFNLKEIFS